MQNGLVFLRAGYRSVGVLRLMLAQDCTECIRVWFIGCPAGGKADDRAGIIQTFPEAELRFLLQFIHPVIADDDENLVRERIEIERVSAFAERLSDLVSCLDCGLSDGLVEVIGEQRIELDAEQPAFGQQGAMLLDDGEKMGNAAFFRQDDGLAQQRAAFGSADIEDITEPGQIRQGQFIGRAGQRISSRAPSR